MSYGFGSDPLGNPYYGDILGASQQYGVPFPILYNLFGAESGYNPGAVSSAGATGLAQFMPGTANQYGVNPLDPSSSIYGAAHYLSDLYQQTGSWAAALGAYSGQGPQLQQYASQHNGFGPALVAAAGGGQAGAGGANSGVSSAPAASAGFFPAVTNLVESLVGRGIVMIVGVIVVAGAVFLMSGTNVAHQLKKGLAA